MGAQALFGKRLEITDSAAELLKNSAKMLRICISNNKIIIKPAKSTNIHAQDKAISIGKSILFIQKEVLDTPVLVFLDNGTLSIRRR